MSKRKDVQIDSEETPLLDGKKNDKKAKFRKSQKEMIQKVEDVGSSDGNPAFRLAVEFTIRTAFFAMVLGSTVWVPFIRQAFPPTLAPYMGLAALLYLFTVNKVLGTTIGNSLTGIFGTWIACTHMWVMQGIFPGGVKPGMSPTDPVALFGWANFIGFQGALLCCQCSMGMKCFACSYNVGFMMDYLNPNSAATYSTNFKIKTSGIAVNCMLATCIACGLAILNNLVPYVQTTAFSAMAAGAKDSAGDIGNLLKVCVQYYCGSKPGIVIHVANKKSRDLREQLDGLGGAIAGCYFEGFDMGVKGTIRKLTDSHATLLNSLLDRVKALLIAASTEDFGESHVTIMEAIKDQCKDVADTVDELMMATTEAMSDGDLDSSEKAKLGTMIKDAKQAVQELSKAFNDVRGTFDASVKSELLGESFFVLTLCAYSRMVCDFADNLCNNPPPGGGNLGGDLANCIKSTWDTTAMFEKYNLNFTIRYLLCTTTGFLLSKYYFNHVGTCAVLCALLINKRVGPDMKATLGVILAVVVGSLTGAIAYNHACDSPYGKYILPACAFVFWLVTLYPYFSGSKFAGVGITMAALAAPRFVALCPEVVDATAAAVALWSTLVAVMFAICLICFYETICAIDRASSLASQGLDQGFKDLKAAFTAFFADKDISDAIAPVAGTLGQSMSFNATADIEPRFWRNDWKTFMFEDVVDKMRALRLDLLMLEFSMEGSGGSAAGLFDKFSSQDSWSNIKSDLEKTLNDAHSLACGLISHETGEFTGLASIDASENIDELEDMPDLIADLAKLVELPDKAPLSMEDDEVCRICAVLMMLQQTCAHVAGIVKLALQNA